MSQPSRTRFRVGFTLVRLPVVSKRKRAAFTLVELLVVIGIIAILVALLLPALQAARRQANTVKCASALREIGNCFLLYAHDTKGWYPPACWQGGPYDINGVTLSTWIWPSWLEKYASKNRQGTASGTNAQEAADARNTIFWGCPEWTGLATSAPGGFDRTLFGYGMNPFPTFEHNSPVFSGGAVYNDDMPPLSVRALIRTGGASGRFMKQRNWTHPSERALVADSFNWRIKAQPEPPNGVYPGQPTPHATRTFSGFKRNQTMVAVNRHGKLPPGRQDADTYLPGGVIKYNILYADGHVLTHSTQHEAYYSIRFGNPGLPHVPTAP